MYVLYYIHTVLTLLGAPGNLTYFLQYLQAYKIAKVNAAKRKEARERYAIARVYTYILTAMYVWYVCRDKAAVQPEIENESIILEGDEEDSDDQDAFADEEDDAEVRG